MFKLRGFLSILFLTAISLLSMEMAFAQRAPTARIPAPFNKAADTRFRALEQEKRLLRLPFTFTSTNAQSGSLITLDKALPAGSYIVKSYVIVDTDIVGASANTVQFGCAASGDLVAVNDYSDDAVHTIWQGAITGEAVSVYTANGCTPKLYVGTGVTGLTSGSGALVLEFLDFDNLVDLTEMKFYP